MEVEIIDFRKFEDDNNCVLLLRPVSHPDSCVALSLPMYFDEYTLTSRVNAAFRTLEEGIRRGI